MNDANEKIELQLVMSYRAYRRGMIISRVASFAVLVAASLAAISVSTLLAVLAAISLIAVCAITIIVCYAEERTYTVYDTKVVIKRRGDDRRTVVPFSDVVGVTKKTAFYERSLGTSTVIVTAERNGRKRKYKLLHILDGEAVLEYLAAATTGRNRREGNG